MNSRSWDVYVDVVEIAKVPPQLDQPRAWPSTPEGSNVSTALNYEELVEDFKRKLLTQLRGHSADAEYLETWVPEEDPVKSILNIVESAEAFGQDEVRVSVAKTTMNAEQQRDLLKLIAPIGRALITDHGQTFEIEVAMGEDQS